MKNSLGLLFSGIFLLSTLQACHQKNDKYGYDDTYKTGKASFVADESFSPILDQEMYVFKALFKEAHPQIIYRSENDALRLFLNDSVRVAILARNLTPGEMDMLRKKALPPEINCFAHDAVTLVVNRSSADTVTTVGAIKDMLNGKAQTDKNIVFDNAKSSLLRYLKDISGNAKLDQKNIFALKSNIEVIKYVGEHPNAIGFISYSWLLEPDKDYAALVDKVKIVGVKDESNKENPQTYFKPSQNTLAMREYPLVRGLYIINSTGHAGLGTGFASFLVSERGQRIVLRSGLLPDSIPTREVSFSK